MLRLVHGMQQVEHDEQQHDEQLVRDEHKEHDVRLVHVSKQLDDGQQQLDDCNEVNCKSYVLEHDKLEQQLLVLNDG